MPTAGRNFADFIDDADADDGVAVAVAVAMATNVTISTNAIGNFIHFCSYCIRQDSIRFKQAFRWISVFLLFFSLKKKYLFAFQLRHLFENCGWNLNSMKMESIENVTREIPQHF